MAQNVTIAGASYSDVPSIEVPKTGGGTAVFADPSGVTAIASDVASGKYFINSSGVLTEGTASGGSVVVVETPDPHGGTIIEITAAVENLETVSVTPTESAQTIVPGPGYSGIAEVDVAAISSTYVGSGIDRRNSTDLSASGATVSVPAGYYESAASKAVASGSVSTPATTITANPTISVSSGGLITATASASQNVTPNVSAGYVSSGTAGTVSVSGSNTQQLTTQAAQTIHPSTTDQTISSGRYLTGAQTINAVTLTNLTADNIKSGVTVQVGDSSDSDCVASILGTYAGGGGGIGTLLNTTSIGSVSSTSTQAANLNKDLSVSGINGYDLLIVEASVNSVTNGRHCATIGMILLTAGTTIGTKNGGTIVSNKLNIKVSSSGTYTSSQSTTAYGIYPNSISISSGVATIPMYRRYNSTSTGTINGTYTARVYGVNLYDLIGG